MTKKQRDQYLKRKYGIGIKEYQLMLKSQGGKCAVCNKPPKNKKRNFHVDHDHKTGEVRGLLCYYCNRRIIGRNTDKTIQYLVSYLMPDYTLEFNDNYSNHFEWLRKNQIECLCLMCIRQLVNIENKLFKPKS